MLTRVDYSSSVSHVQQRTRLVEGAVRLEIRLVALDSDCLEEVGQIDVEAVVKVVCEQIVEEVETEVVLGYLDLRPHERVSLDGCVIPCPHLQSSVVRAKRCPVPIDVKLHC